MRKNELIQLLQQIKGNPEIYIWNGLVDDYMPLKKVYPDKLYKVCTQFIYTQLVYDWKCTNNTFEDPPPEKCNSLMQMAVKAAKSEKYETANPWLEPEQYTNWYGNRPKNIVALYAGIVNKTYEDRLGQIQY